ncbi:V-set and immunoglobulin domain-containing protein 10-like isoform X2 [Scyliorhinus torazame]|uniref:V-set and immunoglobulin domain-containing protein 10-like isoform X2 n=1 Tax=Scyliorhinus torazame TaxID=75743 RepID=UPI003B5AA7FA
MAILVSLLVLLFASLELTSTLIAHENIIDSAPGTAVYFLVEHTGSGISSIIWKFNTSTVIVEALGGSTIYYGAYKDRAKLFTNNATLRLDRVTHEDSGVYEVQVTDDNGSASSAKITLQIYTQMSNVTVVISPVSDGLVEDEDNVTLKCEAQGTSPTFSWSHAGKPLAENPRFILSTDHSSLVIKPVKRSDSNSFICKATNAVSSEHSTPVKLHIYYGPDSPHTNVSTAMCDSNYPGDYCVKEGAEVTLLCQAQCFPDCNYTWWHNGKPDSSKPVHLIQNAYFNNTGNYTCLVKNAYAKKWNYSNISIFIYRPPLGQIACNAEVREDQVNLSCIWAGGIPQTTIELKVGSTSLNGLNEQYYTIAKTDSNLPIDLQCIGQYAMSTQTCRLTLDKPKLSAPTGNKITAGLNADVRLLLLQMKRARRFSATELLPTTFTWSKADTPTIVSGNKFSITSNNTFSQLIIMRFQKADEGTYTCLARNSIGQKAFQFEVYSGNGVNVGLIAGATVGTSAGVTIFLVAAFYIRKKKRESLNDDALKLNQSHKSQSEDVPPDACRDVKILDGSTSEDGAQVVYAQVKILKKKEKTAVDPADPYAKVDKSTKHRNTGVPDVVYSQVKISKKAENEGNN